MQVKLNGDMLPWVNTAKHLGNHLASSRGLLSRGKCPVSAGSQSAKLLPVPHLARCSQIRGAQVTDVKTVIWQTLDNYVYQELEADQAAQQDNFQFYIYKYRGRKMQTLVI